jgi:hypothetical protein
MIDKCCYICKFSTIEEKADPYEELDAIRCPDIMIVFGLIVQVIV